MSLFADLVRYSHLFFKYRSFLRHPYTLDDCKRILRERMETREQRFLSLAKAAIFENPASPYQPLLAEAHCTYHDLESAVLRDGIEASLERLYESGVFFSFEQFKYGNPVECGGRTYQFTTNDFDNPLLANDYYVGSTGGTRSRGTIARLTLSGIAIRAVYFALVLDVHDALNSMHVLWRPVPPAVGGVNCVLRGAKIGIPPVRWFSMTDRKSVRTSALSRLGPYAVAYLGRLFGARLPLPEYLPMSDAAVLAQWIAERKDKGHTCLLNTYASSGVRVCQAAIEHGWDIAGTKLMMTGEPTTLKKMSEIEAAGAKALGEFNMVELGTVASRCGNPQSADDLHLMRDSLALIHRGRRFPWMDEELRALVFTTVSSVAPKIMLNVEMDDCGIVETRRCGCGFDQFEFFEHLRTIRSFSKLSAEGMNVMSSDFLRLFEEVLPGRYGGDSTDYQLAQYEDERGFTRLAILVHPRIGELDEESLLHTVHEELKRGTHFRSEPREMMLHMWSKAGTLQVRCEPPRANPRGKVFPFHAIWPSHPSG